MKDNTKTKKITYIEFGARIKEILEQLETLDEDEKALLIGKAEQLVAANLNKASSSSSRKRESKPSAETLALAEKVRPLLSTEPKTSTDFNRELGEEVFSPLSLSNVLRFVGVETEKVRVVREITNSKGLKQQREYSAYRLV